MDLLTLIFLFIAVVIFLRLRNVLGTRTGHEKPPQANKWPKHLKPVPVNKETDIIEGEVLPAASKSTEARLKGVDAGSPLASSLKFISDADPVFSVEKFLAGAELAYEMIVTAFAKGERDVLRKLLSKDVFDTFNQDIAEREGRGESAELHFIGLNKAEITEAELKGQTARISVAFVAKLVQATRSRQGEVIEGDATQVTQVSDHWTFERNVNSKDPNWVLVDTDGQ